MYQTLFWESPNLDNWAPQKLDLTAEAYDYYFTDEYNAREPGGRKMGSEAEKKRKLMIGESMTTLAIAAHN